MGDGSAAARTKPFTYDRLQLHFIFSFCLSSDEEPLYESDIARILTQPGWTSQLPSDRQKSISPFLSLNLIRAYKRVDWGTADVAGRQVKLSALFRLFEVGGTLTVSMELDRVKEPLKTADAHALLRVLQMSYADKAIPLHSQHQNYASMYELFRETLLEECNSLKQQLGYDISALDFKENLVDAAQSPWLVTAFAVSGEERDAFCIGIDATQTVSGEEKTQRILPYYHEIGPILFRSVSGGSFPLEPTYRGPEGGAKTGSFGVLSNMHLDARMFVCSSRRNVVCIAERLDEEPANYFLPGILSINEGVRARWHALILLNRRLDRILNRYGETVDLGDKTPTGTSKKVESRVATEIAYLQDIILCRRWIGRVLDDAGIYTVSGDALASLYQRGKEIFCLDELKALLLEKAELVDRLHAYEQQLTWSKRD